MWAEGVGGDDVLGTAFDRLLIATVERKLDEIEKLARQTTKN